MRGRRIAWFWAGVLIITIIAYLALVLAPYYLNGIFLQPEGQITGQALDPTQYPPFTGGYEDGTTGSLFLSMAIEMSILFPIVAPLACVGIVVAWYSYFDKSSKLEKVILSTVTATGFLFFCGTITVHRLILTWLMD